MAARQAALAQRVALAQRQAPGEPAAQGLGSDRITWGELGCPQDIGLYRAGGAPGDVKVRVKKIHIIVAENDPAALFTVVTLRPPLGPPEFLLGHRVI